MVQRSGQVTEGLSLLLGLKRVRGVSSYQNLETEGCMEMAALGSRAVLVTAPGDPEQGVRQ